VFAKFIVIVKVGSFVVVVTKSSKHQLAKKLHALELFQQSKAVQGLIFLKSARLSAIRNKNNSSQKVSFYYYSKLKMKVFVLVSRKIYSIAINKNFPIL